MAPPPPSDAVPGFKTPSEKVNQKRHNTQSSISHQVSWWEKHYSAFTFVDPMLASLNDSSHILTYNLTTIPKSTHTQTQEDSRSKKNPKALESQVITRATPQYFFPLVLNCSVKREQKTHVQEPSTTRTQHTSNTYKKFQDINRRTDGPKDWTLTTDLLQSFLHHHNKSEDEAKNMHKCFQTHASSKGKLFWSKKGEKKEKGREDKDRTE